MQVEMTEKFNTSKVWTTIIYIFLSILVVIYVAPLIWIVSVSLKDTNEIIDSPFGFPKDWYNSMLQNYSDAWNMGSLGKATLNSLFVCVIVLVVSLFLSAMAAFAIGRMRWKLSNLCLTYFMIGMMVPVHCLLIPLFVKFSNMKLTDSLWGLMIPYIVFSMPMSIYLMVGFFKSIPNELFEAACIDGCSIYRCFTVVGIPLCRTGFFVSGLMTFVNNWNELLLAMVFIHSAEKKTLPVALTAFASPYKTSYDMMFAGIVIAVIPTIIVYSAFSNQIVEGLTTGAVKG